VSRFAMVGRIGDLQPGEKKIVDVEGMAIVLVNLNGTYHALEDVCTHDGGPLGEGELDSGQLVCPRHGARFDILTGAALTLPAFEPVPKYEVRIENGEILVEVY
jgi:3-phenylpropionate/trans-cinnamate dioxygenase ferredoxin component